MSNHWRLVAFGLGAWLLAGCAGNGGELPDGYCYRTLGAVDCYTTPESNRPPVGIIENSRPPPPTFGNAAAYAVR